MQKVKMWVDYYKMKFLFKPNERYLKQFLEWQIDLGLIERTVSFKNNKV